MAAIQAYKERSVSPTINPETDVLIPVRQIALERLGRKLNFQTIARWVTEGILVGGERVKLEAVRTIGGVWATTLTAWGAFIYARTRGTSSHA